MVSDWSLTDWKSHVLCPFGRWPVTRDLWFGDLCPVMVGGRSVMSSCPLDGWPVATCPVVGCPVAGGGWTKTPEGT